jgi:Tol biopolymer transport system component
VAAKVRVGFTDPPVSKAAAPVITGISPTKASAGTGTSVTITGSGFGDTGKPNFVDFTYKPAGSGGPESPSWQWIPANQILNWEDTRIVCEVPVEPLGRRAYPASSGSGPVRVMNAAGLWSNTVDLSISFGFLWRWAAPVVKYTVVTSNAGWREMVKAAAETWSDSGSAFRFVYVGNGLGKPSLGNGINEIYWGEASSMASTDYRPGPLSDPNGIGETDIVFNNALPWGSHVKGKWDVRTIALHEMGHVVGLRDLYGAADRGKAMYGYRDHLGHSNSIVHSLSPDDIAGARWIYPPAPAGNGRIAFVRDGDIWTMNADGTHPLNLTSSPSKNEFAPSWSPKHDRIAFIRGTPGDLNSDQPWVMNADGSGAKALAFVIPYAERYQKGPITSCAWSPEGRHLLLTQHFADRAFPSRLLVADLSTRRASVLLDPGLGEAAHLSWSPDGKRIMATYREYSPTFGIVMCLDATTGKRSLMPSFWLPSSPQPDVPYAVRSAAWSPDGSRVAYVTTTEWPSIPEQPRVIWSQLVVMPVTGGSHIVLDSRITSDSGCYISWDVAWSGDGKLLAYDLSPWPGSGDSQLRIVDAATGEAKASTANAGDAAWSQ